MFQASFASWIQLLGGTLAVGVIALAVGIIHERRRSH
jgi:hypothetical protein